MKPDKFKVIFVYAEKDREFNLADRFLLGVSVVGDDVRKVRKGEFKLEELDGDVYCLVGVKSLRLFRELRGAGKHVLFFDKGYFRHRGPNRVWEYWRIAVNDHHPTDYVEAAEHSSARWDTISARRAVKVKPWNRNGSNVIFAGSSEKYHAFCGLSEPTSYAKGVIKQIKSITNRLVIYRPKPTWQDAEPIKGSTFSPPTENIYNLLQDAWCLVTNGSNASFDAIIEGVPTIVLGRAIARPISSTSLDDLENPRLAGDDERNQWLSNLAWCMFTEQEMAMGLAWKAIRPQLLGQMLDDSQLNVIAGVAMKPSKALLKKMGEWRKIGKKTRTKEEQRRIKPFTKQKVYEPPDEMM